MPILHTNTQQALHYMNTAKAHVFTQQSATKAPIETTRTIMIACMFFLDNSTHNQAQLSTCTNLTRQIATNTTVPMQQYYTLS